MIRANVLMRSIQAGRQVRDKETVIIQLQYNKSIRIIGVEFVFVVLFQFNDNGSAERKSVSRSKNQFTKVKYFKVFFVSFVRFAFNERERNKICFYMNSVFVCVRALVMLWCVQIKRNSLQKEWRLYLSCRHNKILATLRWSIIIIWLYKNILLIYVNNNKTIRDSFELILWALRIFSRYNVYAV